jgi:hypothetical protein
VAFTVLGVWMLLSGDDVVAQAVGFDNATGLGAPTTSFVHGRQALSRSRATVKPDCERSRDHVIVHSRGVTR